MSSADAQPASLAAELHGTSIGMSMLCPAWVKAQMLHHGANRPARHGGPIDLAADTANGARIAGCVVAPGTGTETPAIVALVPEQSAPPGAAR